MNKKIYTISDIAEYARVSRSTVSRVLNNVKTKVLVSAETTARIEEAVKHFDYSPNANARRLSNNKSNIIGLQVPTHHLGRYVFSDYNLIGAMHGLEEALMAHDYKLLLLFQSKKYMNDKEYLTLLKNRSIDGLLIWGTLRDVHYDSNLADYPVLFMNTLPDEHAGFNFICHDNYRGGYDLTAGLIKRGARKFRYLMGPTTNSITVDRYRGFRDALADNHIVFNEQRLSHGDFHQEGARLIFAPIFKSGTLDFDAVVCSNDMMATGVYQSALDSRHAPNVDFWLAGGDGVEDCAKYPMSTFKVDRFDMGFQCMQKIIKLIDGGRETIQEFLSTQVTFCEKIIRRKNDEKNGSFLK